MIGPEQIVVFVCRMLAKHGATREQLNRNMPAVIALANAAMHPKNFEAVMAELASLDARLTAGEQQVGRIYIGTGTQQ